MESPRYYFHRFLSIFDLSLRYRDLVHLYQKLTRGFSDKVTWSLDLSIAEWILPRLKRFKEVNIGYPPELTVEEYDDILDKMILAFELKATEFEWEFENKETIFANYAKIDEGLSLFAKYYHDLWW